MQAFLISLVFSNWIPFICYHHPNNISRSLVACPDILCGTEENIVMGAGGIFGFLFGPAAFIVLVVYGIKHYPMWASNDQCSRQLKAFQFLFLRYSAECYYYSAVVILRNFILCLVPVVIEDDLGMQITTIRIIIVVFIVVQLILLTFRSYVCNVFEPVVNSIVVALCGVFSFDLRFIQAQCIFGGNSIQSYFLRQSLAPIVVLLSFVPLAIMKMQDPSLDLRVVHFHHDNSLLLQGQLHPLPLQQLPAYSMLLRRLHNQPLQLQSPWRLAHLQLQRRPDNQPPQRLLANQQPPQRLFNLLRQRRLSTTNAATSTTSSTTSTPPNSLSTFHCHRRILCSPTPPQSSHTTPLRPANSAATFCGSRIRAGPWPSWRFFESTRSHEP